MAFKYVIGKLHLWLGFTSGLLVFIIALTGCIYAFQEEISNLTQPYRFVAAQPKPFLPPSRIKTIAEKELPGKTVHAIQYQGAQRAAKAIFYSNTDDYYYFVYVDPYTGRVLKVKNENRDFFRFIINGHFYLWLPPAVGQPIVAWATLVFFIMIITGLILWWPKSKSARKQRFTIKSNTRWRRKNYDLHNVLGFYAFCIAVIFAVTGLVWGFEWFRDSYYALSTGGKKFPEYKEPVSVKKQMQDSLPGIDRVWLLMKKEYPAYAGIEVHVPEDSVTCIAANANPDPDTYWQTDYRYFDQYSLKELSVNHLWGRFGNNSGGDKLMKMNYDLHVGSILGLPGKILAFSASLIIASLPITGFLIWWGRRNKK